jgi:hypothetical protein
MIRNLKMLGIALVAVFAMSASAASAASQGILTSDGPVSLTGTESEEGFLITFSPTLKYYCHTHYVIGGVNMTPHGFTSTPVKTLTIAPQFSECEMDNGGTETPATFTMNGCDFVLHIGEGEAGKYGTTLDFVCPAGKEIEFHAYSNATHATTICTFKLSAQTGISGATVSNGGGGIKLGGTFGGIHDVKTGILCGGTSESNSVQLDVGGLITGKNEGGAATEISLTS